MTGERLAAGERFFVIARPKGVAIWRCVGVGVDCRAALAMTGEGLAAGLHFFVIARPKAVAIWRCLGVGSARTG
jgi:hypothetical protein